MGENIDFSQAKDAVLDGKRITRKEWHDIRHYGILKDGILHIHKAGESDEMLHPWILNEDDLSALDWVILDDKAIGNNPKL